MKIERFTLMRPTHGLEHYTHVYLDITWLLFRVKAVNFLFLCRPVEHVEPIILSLSIKANTSMRSDPDTTASTPYVFTGGLIMKAIIRWSVSG